MGALPILRVMNVIFTQSKTFLTTSNHHPDYNFKCFYTLSGAKDFHENETIRRTEAPITKMYTKMSMDLTNSFISFEVIKMYPWESQAFLEKIADFLVEERVYYTELVNGIQSNDLAELNLRRSIILDLILCALN